MGSVSADSGDLGTDDRLDGFLMRRTSAGRGEIIWEQWDTHDFPWGLMEDLVLRHEDEVNGRRVTSCMARVGRVEALCELFPFRVDVSQSLLAAGVKSAAEAQVTCPTKPRVRSWPLELLNRSERDEFARGHCR